MTGQRRLAVETPAHPADPARATTHPDLVRAHRAPGPARAAGTIESYGGRCSPECSGPGAIRGEERDRFTPGVSRHSKRPDASGRLLPARYRERPEILRARVGRSALGHLPDTAHAGPAAPALNRWPACGKLRFPRTATGRMNIVNHRKASKTHERSSDSGADWLVRFGPAPTRNVRGRYESRRTTGPVNS